MTPSAESLSPDRFPERLQSVRACLQALPPDEPSGLADPRDELGALAEEAEGLGFARLAASVRRLALLTEVWECLALEGPEGAAGVAQFCVEALGRLADDPSDEVAGGILAESSNRWSDYLQLLDPEFAAAVDPLSIDEPEPLADPPPEPTLDPALLLRLLSAAADVTPPAEEEETPPPPRKEITPSANGHAAHKPVAREARPEPGAPPPRVVPREVTKPALPARPAEPELDKKAIRQAMGRLDPELRQAFITEASELFERVETLVARLEREPGSTPVLDELGRALHTLKGAAGSVGLAELAATVHAIEDALEAAAGASPDDLMHRLDGLLALFDAVLKAPEAAAPPPAAKHAPAVPASRPAEDKFAPVAMTESLLRIPPERIEALMDLVSELIVRRGVWSAQVDAMKDFADNVRASRARLLACVERLDLLGPDPRGELAHVMRGLTEQADDLALLAQTAKSSAVPLADDGDALARISLQLWEQLQAVQIVPVRGLFHRLARVARDAARVEGREIEVVMVGEETGLDRVVQDKAFEPLLHIVRNAVGHGIERPTDRVSAGKGPAGRITLEARREGNALVIAVEDDGRGLDDDAIEAKGRRLGLLGPNEAPSRERLHALIFHPGFSTRDVANEVSGRGVGMDVVAQEVSRMRGTIHLASQPGQGTTITMRLPTRLAVERVLITRVDDQAFGLPIALVEHAEAFDAAACERDGARETVRVGDRTLPLLDARRALGIGGPGRGACPKLLVVRAESGAVGLVVDSIEGARELVIKPLGPLLAGHPMIAGTSVLLTGEVILIVNPSPLGSELRTTREAKASAPQEEPRPTGALVVDDSLSVRRVVVRHLHSLGFDVDEVSNGLEALHKLKTRPYRLVLTDLEMPRMDGFELLAELGRLSVQPASPVIVVSTRSDSETRKRVQALGARAFVPKPIEPNELTRAVRGLVPELV